MYCDGSTYAYHETRECLPACPTGFYQNTYTDGGGAQHNICEEECSVTLDGDELLGENSTGTCVEYCPANSFADF